MLKLGGIAKNRKAGSGNEREFTKKIVSEMITKKHLKKAEGVTLPW